MNFNSLNNSEKSLIMRNNYKRWKLEGLDEAGYFIVFQGFLEGNKLKHISGNALKLYIYLGMNSNNIEGIVWHSNKKIADYFEKSERTIRTWMKELEDLRLIRRMRLKYDGVVYTYLQPYIYKYNDFSNENNEGIEIVEGILNIDKIGGLYIKGENTYTPILNSMYIEIWSEEKNDWISGKIEIRRSVNYLDEDQDKNIYYIFRSNNNKLIIKMEDIINKNLKVRAISIFM